MPGLFSTCHKAVTFVLLLVSLCSIPAAATGNYAWHPQATSHSHDDYVREPCVRLARFIGYLATGSRNRLTYHTLYETIITISMLVPTIHVNMIIDKITSHMMLIWIVSLTVYLVHSPTATPISPLIIILIL